MGLFAQVVEFCGTTRKAAQALGCSRGTLSEKLKVEKESPEHVWAESKTMQRAWQILNKKDESKEGWFGVEIPFKPAPEPEDPLEARRKKNQVDALQARIKALETDLIKAQDVIDQHNKLHKARVEPNSWLPIPHIKGQLSLTPVLFTSDFQVGEVIKAEEIDGMNAYNMDIFVERYQKLIEKTIHLTKENTGATEFPRIVYLRGGDAISNSIHEELAETNDLSAIPACRLLFQQEREGIKRLREVFGRVSVISLPGNHGRCTHKSHSKGYAHLNFETMLSWWLATAFEQDPNVTFWTPNSTDALFNVEGWNLLMSHGDKIGARGGTGFIGPAANIAKGHFKIQRDWNLTGQRIDLILTGHFHTSLKLERGYANGTLAGFSEYARDLRCLPDSAKQWLLCMHKESMISHSFEINLSERPVRFGAWTD